MSEFLPTEAMTLLRRRLAEHRSEKPGEYSSKWNDALDEVISQILNREEFQYDLGLDPLFQQYQDRYVNLGQRSMMDTLARSAGLTGGYGNSHAQLAAQQAYDAQLQGLYDKLPELYQLAMDRYKLTGEGLMDRYGILKGQEGQDYTRYTDALQQWQQEHQYLADRYDAERDFGYGAHRDAVGDGQWQQEFDEKQRQFNFKNKLGEFAPPPAAETDPGTGGTSRKRKKASQTKPEKERSKIHNTLRTWKEEDQ